MPLRDSCAEGNRESKGALALREGSEDREARLEFAAHHGTISDLDPGVSLKLIRVAGDAIEELAGDVAAAKHEVRGQALRETDKGQGGVTGDSLDRPLNPAKSLRRLLLRDRPSRRIWSAHPGSELLHRKKTERDAEKSEHASRFDGQADVSSAVHSGGKRDSALDACQAIARAAADE